MNPSEQHAHRSITGQLQARTQVLEDLVEHHTTALLRFLPATADELADVRAMIGDLRLAIGNERTHRLQLAQEQRSYVDAADRQILAAINEVCGWSLRQRLRWLLTGRR